jgi:hypothetical protein
MLHLSRSIHGWELTLSVQDANVVPQFTFHVFAYVSWRGWGLSGHDQDDCRMLLPRHRYCSTPVHI